MGMSWCESLKPWAWFSRSHLMLMDTARTAVLLAIQNPFFFQRNSRALVSNAEKTTLHRVQAGVSSSVHVSTRETSFPTVTLPGLGIRPWFPFGCGHGSICTTIDHCSIEQCFHYALGSTDSCSTAVHTKPISTSVLQGLPGVFATTTKICTTGSSSQDHSQSLPHHRFDLPTCWAFRVTRTCSGSMARYK